MGTYQGNRQGRFQDRGNYQFQPCYGQGYGQQPPGRQPYSYGQQSPFSGAGPYAQPPSSQRPYVPNAYSAPPQTYGQYGQQSDFRQQAPPLPAPRQLLQIGAPPNVSASTSSNRPANQGYGNQNRFQRNDRRFPGNGNRWQQNSAFRQKALAYQATAEDAEEEQEPSPPAEEGSAYHSNT